jgi:phage shock protein A
MSITTTVAKKILHDKIESQINTVQAKLSTLKAKAQTAKANAELKAIGDLVAEKAAIDQKLATLKASGEATYDKAKSDVESRVAQLEKSVQALEAKFKSA